jgi:hypothetical protein
MVIEESMDIISFKNVEVFSLSLKANTLHPIIRRAIPEIRIARGVSLLIGANN